MKRAVLAGMLAVICMAGAVGAQVYTYYIEYHLNGGYGIGPMPIAYEYTTEKGATLPTILMKTGYTFAGWYPNRGTLGFPVTSIPAGSLGDKEFWAGWTPITYTITYNLNGGVQAPNAAANYNAETSTTLPVPTRDGYTFDSWYDNAGFIGLAVTSIPAGSSGNKTFWAKWASSTTTYAITYNIGGDGANIAIQVDWPLNYSAEDLPLSLPVPIRDGFTFDGWIDSDSNTVKVIPAGSTGNMEFWPNGWTQNVKITLADRVIPTDNQDGLSAVVPRAVSFAGEFTAGPNAVQKRSGRVNIFRQGKRVENGTLTVYNSLGDAVNKINIRDNLSVGDLSKHAIGCWDLTDAKGRPAPSGAYLLKGTITTVDGKKERVSLKVSVR